MQLIWWGCWTIANTETASFPSSTLLVMDQMTNIHIQLMQQEKIPAPNHADLTEKGMCIISLLHSSIIFCLPVVPSNILWFHQLATCRCSCLGTLGQPCQYTVRRTSLMELLLSIGYLHNYRISLNLAGSFISCVILLDDLINQVCLTAAHWSDTPG